MLTTWTGTISPALPILGAIPPSLAIVNGMPPPAAGLPPKRCVLRISLALCISCLPTSIVIGAAFAIGDVRPLITLLSYLLELIDSNTLSNCFNALAFSIPSVTKSSIILLASSELISIPAPFNSSTLYDNSFGETTCSKSNSSNSLNNGTAATSESSSKRFPNPSFILIIPVANAEIPLPVVSRSTRSIFFDSKS